MKIPHQPGDSLLQRVCAQVTDWGIDLYEAVAERLEKRRPRTGDDTPGHQWHRDR